MQLVIGRILIKIGEFLLMKKVKKVAKKLAPKKTSGKGKTGKKGC